MKNLPMPEDAAFPVLVEIGEEPLMLPIAGLGAELPPSGRACVDYSLDEKGNMVISALRLPDPEAVEVEDEDEPQTLEAALGEAPIEDETDEEEDDED